MNEFFLSEVWIGLEKIAPAGSFCSIARMLMRGKMIEIKRAVAA
jgi:hypothetical protein